MRELDRLLTSHGPSLHALLTRLTLRPDVAEDLMQDLFLQLARSNGFDQATDRVAYAFRCAINLAMAWRRQRRSRPAIAAIVVEPPDTHKTTLGGIIDAEQLNRTLDALDLLSEESRQIVVLRFIQDQPYETIARQIGRTAHTTRALCHKAIRRLRAVLNEKESEARSA